MPAGHEIESHDSCGPFFGHSELRIMSIEYERRHGRSEANKSCFKIPVEDGKNRLTDMETSDFAISEVEVWQLIEMEQ